MKINGSPIMEFERYDLGLLKKIVSAGKAALKSDASSVSSEEKAFLKAADNALCLERLYEISVRNKKNQQSSLFDTFPLDGIAAAASQLYIMAESGVLAKKMPEFSEIQDARDMKAAVSEIIASVLLFHAWNVYINDDSTFSEWKNQSKGFYSADVDFDLEYGLDISNGREHFMKMGIIVVNSDEPSQKWYFDALKVGRDTVENDFLSSKDGRLFAGNRAAVMDIPYFRYRVVSSVIIEGKKTITEPAKMNGGKNV